MRAWTDKVIHEYMEKMYVDKPITKLRAVIGLFQDGSEIEFVSIREAEKATGCNHGSISDCCRHGKCKSVKGIVWRYKR